MKVIVACCRIKYRYNQASLAPLVQSIVRIVLNTLESQYHRCYRYGGIGATLTHAHPPGHGAPFSGFRTREQSQASFGSDADVLIETDPKGDKGSTV